MAAPLDKWFKKLAHQTEYETWPGSKDCKRKISAKF